MLQPCNSWAHKIGRDCLVEYQIPNSVSTKFPFLEVIFAKRTRPSVVHTSHSELDKQQETL